MSKPTHDPARHSAFTLSLVQVDLEPGSFGRCDGCIAEEDVMLCRMLREVASCAGCVWKGHDQVETKGETNGQAGHE